MPLGRVFTGKPHTTDVGESDDSEANGKHGFILGSRQERSNLQVSVQGRIPCKAITAKTPLRRTANMHRIKVREGAPHATAADASSNLHILGTHVAGDEPFHSAIGAVNIQKLRG